MASAALSILIADDDRDTVDTMALLLQHHGHKTFTATDGPTTITLAQRELPDLLLLDLAMPRMNGYAVARQLRQLPELQKMVIACVSGYGNEEDRERARAAGCDTHLLKPIDFASLDAVIARTAAVRADFRRAVEERQRILIEQQAVLSDLRAYWERFHALAADSAQLLGRKPASD